MNYSEQPAMEVDLQPEAMADPLPAEPTTIRTERRIPTPTPDGLLTKDRDDQQIRKSANDPDYLQMKYAATGVITLPMRTVVALPPPPPPPPLYPAAAAVVAGGFGVAGVSNIPQPAPTPQQAMDGSLRTEVAPAFKVKEVWQCHKCKRDNLASKARCGSCQAWRGGKRESYSKSKLSTQQYNMIPQVPWTCPCGNTNAIKKVRCTKCQKWKGGRRHNKGILTAKWYAEQMILGNLESSTEPLVPWTCDKCNNLNGPRKVRCENCPRWKNGKRAKFGKKNAAAAAAALAIPKNNPAPLPTAPTTAAVVDMIGQRGGMMGHTMTDGEIEKFENARGNWFCAGCNHLNEAKKARCGSCQHWKFGKRENMLKKNRTAPPQKKTVEPTPTNKETYRVKTTIPSELSKQQHQQVSAVADPATAEILKQHLKQQPAVMWTCTCKHINYPEKTRCSSCQKWKGGRRGSLRRKSTKGICIKTEVVNNQVATAVGKTGMMMIPNQPNMPWKCASCQNDNDMRKLRCGTCQSWKNGKKQLSQRAKAQSLLPATEIDKLSVVHPTDGALYVAHWKCHGCHAQVPSIKNRCPSCKSWKGGVRDMGTKRKPPFWICHCKRENDMKRVRCGGCMGWRGGKRPEAAHRQDKVQNGNWTCERCQRPNKKSKVRCGGCQRWRGGMRPDMRKSAKAARAAAAPNGHQQFMLSVKHVPQFPPFQMPQMTMVAGPALGHNIMTQPVAQPVARPLTFPGQAHMNGTNTAHIKQQNQVVQMAPPAATADGGKANVAWTCQKCTCDNLATELKCKICDGLR